MARLKVKAFKRTILGRKVKNLRKEGILPANLFGKGVKSQSLQLKQKEFTTLFGKVGETGLVDLVIDKQKARPVLISNVQLNPVSDEPLHVDFHQVNLKEKTSATVEIKLMGTAPAVEKDEGVLVQTLSEVEVEALPADLPEHLQVDISSLKAIDDSLRVKDLKAGKGVEIKAGANEIIVKISAPTKEEEVTPQPAEAEGEEAAQAEGGAPAVAGTDEEEKKEAGKKEDQPPVSEASKKPQDKKTKSSKS